MIIPLTYYCLKWGNELGGIIILSEIGVELAQLKKNLIKAGHLALEWLLFDEHAKRNEQREVSVAFQ